MHFAGESILGIPFLLFHPLIAPTQQIRGKKLLIRFETPLGLGFLVVQRQRPLAVLFSASAAPTFHFFRGSAHKYTRTRFTLTSFRARLASAAAGAVLFWQVAYSIGFFFPLGDKQFDPRLDRHRANLWGASSIKRLVIRLEGPN